MARLTEKERAALHKSVQEGANRKPQSKPATQTVQQQGKIEFKGALGGSKPGEQAASASYNNRQILNEKRMGGGDIPIVRPSESASARSMHEKNLQEPGSNQPDFLKPQLSIGEALRKFQSETPVPEKPKSANEKLGEKLQGLPVIGPVVKGLEKASNFIKPATDVAEQLYVPGVGAAGAAEEALTQLFAKGTAKVAPKIVGALAKISPEAASAVAKAAPLAPKVAASTAVGAYTGAGQQLAAHPDSTVKETLEGAALGGALGGSLPVVGAGVKKLVNRNALGGGSSGPTQPENYKGNWFNNLFGNKGLGIAANGKKTGNAVQSGDVIVSKAIKENPKNIIADSAKAAHKALVNRFEPLKKVGKNVFETAEDASRGNQIANQILGKEFVTPEGNVVGEGFESIMKSVPRGEDRTLFDYLIVKDAQARVARGERVFDENLKIPDPANPMDHIELNTEEGLKARLAQLENKHPWLKVMSPRWNNFTKNLREVYGVNEGLLNDQSNAALVAARPDYVKMRRQFTRQEKPRGQRGAPTDTFSGKKAPIQAVNKYGSARNIVDPRKTVAEDVGRWVNNALRNRVGQELVKNIESDPDAFKGIAEIVPHNSPTKPGVENTINVMVKGEPVKLRIHDPEVYEAFQGMNPTQLGLVLQIAKAGSNFVKKSATGVLAPAFAAKSALVDLPTALIQAKGNRFRFLSDYVNALGSGFASKFGNNRWAQLAKDYERAGGGFSAVLRGEKSLNKATRKLERNPILSPKAIKNAAASTIAAPFKATEELANVFENAPRIAAYKGELRRLGGDKTPENIRKAMQEGREITVNYSRKGTVSDELEAISPYTNAAIQGVSRVARQFKNKPIKTLAGLTAIVGLPKAFEYTQFHDDPDYQRLPAREKFRNLIVHKNEDGTFTKIPLEPSYAAFGAVALDFYDYVKTHDPEAFKGMADSLSNAFLPPLASGALQGLTQGGEGTQSPIEKSLGGLINATSASPAASIFANQSFTGAPIDSAAVADRSPQYRYDEKTSSVAKWLGSKLNFSPMKIDYLIKQYGGDLARFGLPAFSDVGKGTKQQTLLRNFIVDPVFTNNLTNDYYTGKSLLSTAEKDNEEADAPLPPWYNSDLVKELTTTKKGSITAQLKELTAQKKEINSDRSLSASEKTQKIRGIQRQINNIYIDVNAKMKAAGVPFPRR